jgi:hypothetical protein
MFWPPRSSSSSLGLLSVFSLIRKATQPDRPDWEEFCLRQWSSNPGLATSHISGGSQPACPSTCALSIFFTDFPDSPGEICLPVY